MKSTLNLADNPFDPDLPGRGRRSGEDPLKAGIHPELLEKLVCATIAGTGAAEAKLRSAVFLDNTAEGAYVRRNAILLIVGGRGSGRSTLASLMRRRILATKDKSGAEWRTFDLLFDRYLPPPDFAGDFRRLRENIKNVFGDGPGAALVTIDNLPKSSFNYVMSEFDAFPQLTRVFVVTTTDAELLHDRELDAAGIHIEAVELTKLTADEVRTFIAERVPQYRANDIPALRTEPDLSLFPFTEGALGTTAGKPVQAVRTWAYRRIDEKHNELLARPGLVEAALADLGDLRSRLIQS